MSLTLIDIARYKSFIEQSYSCTIRYFDANSSHGLPKYLMIHSPFWLINVTRTIQRHKQRTYNTIHSKGTLLCLKKKPMIFALWKKMFPRGIIFMHIPHTKKEYNCQSLSKLFWLHHLICNWTLSRPCMLYTHIMHPYIKEIKRTSLFYFRLHIYCVRSSNPTFRFTIV